MTRSMFFGGSPRWGGKDGMSMFAVCSPGRDRSGIVLYFRDLPVPARSDRLARTQGVNATGRGA
jgi:hypothetical protein